jgi:cytochrome d ubiquinol oxidase subunit I
VVKGLDAFPPQVWPPVAIVHYAFQLMVALGTYLALVGLWGIWLALRRADHASHPWFLRAVALSAPLGFIAIEAGWTVTEVGRQPWIVYGILRTAEAVTPMPGLIVPFLGFTLLYCFLGVIVAWLLYSQIIRSPRDSEWSRRYAPEPSRHG